MPTRSYLPDDAGITLASLQFLQSPEGLRLRAAVASLPGTPAEPSVSQVAVLRREFPHPHVHAALTFSRLQPKAAAKFPGIPFLWSPPEALEQASSMPVARHKSQRFATLNPSHILDLCAGIGGDTLALADIAPTTAVELSPIRSACLQINLQATPPRHPVRILTQDLLVALPSLPRDSLFHLDPARRSAGKRSPNYTDLIPGPETLSQIISRFPGGAIKLSPAVDFESLPAGADRQPGHLELITHHRTVVQAILWLGSLANLFPSQSRTATIITDGHPPYSFTAIPHPAKTSSEIFTYVYEADGALTRAQLAQPLADSLQLSALTADAGYLTAPALILHPLLTPFQILETVRPYSEKRVKELLRRLPSPSTALQPGPVEVKTRGRLPQVHTDSLQQSFSQATSFSYTILIFNHQSTPAALITQRL